MNKKMSKVVLSTALLFGGMEVVASQHASAATNTVMSYVNVSDEEGVNINGAHVVLFDGDNQVASAVTDLNGRASFDNLEDNKIYRIEVEGVKISNAYFKKGNDLNVAVLREELPSAPVVESVAGATFTAHVINNDMQNVANQKVELYDITEGKVFYRSMMTDANGNVVFDVPANRNFAVYVNGVNQGYTVRGAEGSKLENTFYVDAKGEGKYNAETKPATVFVVDENDNPLAGQKVALYRGDKMVAEAMTMENGKLVFGDNLTVGTHYDIYLNGKKVPNKFVMAGDTAYVYGTPIMKEETKEEQQEIKEEMKKEQSLQEEKKKDNKDEDSKKLPKVMDEKKKLDQPEMKSSMKQDEMKSEKDVMHEGNKNKDMTAMNKSDNKKEMKQVAPQEMKKLPMTGEQQGLLSGVASMLLVAGAGILTFIRRK